MPRRPLPRDWSEQFWGHPLEGYLAAAAGALPATLRVWAGPCGLAAAALRRALTPRLPRGYWTGLDTRFAGHGRLVEHLVVCQGQPGWPVAVIALDRGRAVLYARSTQPAVAARLAAVLERLTAAAPPALPPPVEASPEQHSPSAASPAPADTARTPEVTLPAGLSARDRKLLEGWRAGQSVAELKRALNLTERTVRNRLSLLRRHYGLAQVPLARDRDTPTATQGRPDRDITAMV